MARKVFINLPVKNLKRSVDLFTQLGFEFNPPIHRRGSHTMIINDDAFVMLVVDDFFKTWQSSTRIRGQ